MNKNADHNGDEKLTCKCGKAGKSGPCPFAQDIHNKNEEDAECTCCSKCRKECLYDI